MAYRTIAFEGAEITDSNATDGVVVVGDLRFTVTAEGNWTLNFSNGRLNFAEDMNFAGSQFKIEITSVTGGPLQYNDFIINYQSNPLVVDGWAPYLNFSGLTISDTDLTGNYTHNGEFSYKHQISGFPMPGSGVVTKLVITDHPANGSTQNPYSSFWIDNLVVDTDFPPPDTIAPTVTSITRTGAESANGSSVSYTVTFSESVTGVDASDFTLTTTGSASGTITGISGSGTTYTVTVTGLAGYGTLRLDLKNSGTGIRDLASNPIGSGYSSGEQYSLVNDAPVLVPWAPTLNPLTDTDVNWVGQAVSSLLGTSVSDVDYDAVKGIAVTGLASGNGTWQYSTNGGASWDNIGNVSDGSALLLRAADRVRFVPDGVNGTTASLTYRAWDQTGATAGQHGTKVDATATGGSTPFSTGTDTASITVTAVNDAPVVSTSGGASTFTEADNSASPLVAVDAGLTLSDSDNATLASATVSIVGNFMSDQDLLSFVNNDPAGFGNITASYNAGTGVLTLISAGASATVAQWQAALRSVTYGNTSDMPSTAARVISFTVHDGMSDSNPVTKNVNVSSTNDAPKVTAPSNLTLTEDAAAALTGISFSDADAGSSNVTVTFAVASGMLSATSGSGVTVGGTASALTLTGSLANINAFIDANRLTFTPASNMAGSLTLNVTITDGGNTGSGGAKTAAAAIILNIAPVNDAPVITAPVSIAVNEDEPTALTGISFADVDAAGGLVTVSLLLGSGTLTAEAGGNVAVSGSGSGTLILSGTIADINAFLASGQVVYRTDPDATSNVVLNVRIDDNGNTGSGGNQQDVASVTLVVTAVNDAPVHDVPGPQTMEQDASLVFSSANGNLITVSDPDAGSGTLRVTLTAAQGLLSLASTTGLAFAVGSGTADPTMTFEGSLASINAALNGMIFTPLAGYYGPASIRIDTSDLGSSGAGGVQSDSDTIAIVVDSLEPKVTDVHVTNPDGRYKAGDTLFVTVGFDQAVTVNTGSGTPTLLLETGDVDRRAAYVSGSGTRTLTFAYTVQEGDASADLDYHSTAALVLNGATIRNMANDDAILTLPMPGGAGSIAGQHAIVIENVLPPSEPPPPASGPVVTPNADGGVDIVITDPSQLTGTLGTSGVDQVVYSGSGLVILPDTIENLTLTGGNAHAQGNGLDNALRGSAGDNALWGADGNDWVHGGGGNDTVDGGSGRDYIFGGTGDDLIQGGAGNDTLYGYKDDDRLFGGSGHDLMSGSAGNDTVRGGSGNDTVNGGSGHDRVFGDSGRDIVYGGKGNDTIHGGTGNDTLFGHAGRDVFVFDTKLNRRGNVDTIKDFNVASDSIWLDNAIFTRLGTGTMTKPGALESGFFVVGSRALDADDYLIYDRNTGVLSYDADGSGAKAAVAFARLKKGLALTHKDFFVV